MTTKKSDSTLNNLNETGKRGGQDRRNSQQDETLVERRKTKRRRQIDPTTCEREYNNAEIEFMHALDEYKRASGRMFPTCSEILEVFLGLGYRKLAEPTDGFAMNQSEANEDTEELDFGEDSLEEELEEEII